MNTPLIITTDDLIVRLAEKHPPLILDVMGGENFTTGHIPGAKNACVYEVTFLDHVRELLTDPATPLVVYDSGPNNLASTTAAEKLREAGYTGILEYRGGLEAWSAAGQFVEREEGEPGVALHETPRDGTHRFDLVKSKIEWIGRNLASAHSGTIGLQSGSIEIADGQLVQGTFTLDMTTIQDRDLEDPGWREMLIHHLMSDDFFDVKKFPEATFDLLKVTPINSATPGSPNYEVTGELLLKGVRRQIAFTAMIGFTAEGVLAADAHFDIDRTDWNVLYGSGKFYEKLGKHLVNDEITLNLKLVTI
jgi:polyisoprenoid-binding protein YceI/rhodanese-related sulfurtransferase